jgi:hypothetical protein
MSMSARGIQLLEAANGQMSELIDLLSTRGESALRLPCSGREKLGDGTVAAVASHTAGRYQRIATFLQATSQPPDAHTRRRHGVHRIPRFRPSGSHAPRDHVDGSHNESVAHDDYCAETVDLRTLLERLSAGRDVLSLLADLTDEQLDAVPPAGSFRFCDGQRNLEQVMASLLKHQSHQIDALKAAVTGLLAPATTPGRSKIDRFRQSGEVER